MLSNAFETRLQTVLSKRQASGRLRTVASSASAKAASDLIDFSSNDYLSFSREESLKRDLISALQDGQPYGPASSRLLDGNSQEHQTLERDLIRFFGGTCPNDKQALLFNSGWDANVSIFGTIAGVSDVILYDEYIHASVHDGMHTSRAAQCLAFKHNSVTDFQSKVKSFAETSTKSATLFVAIEALYSMDGDVPDLLQFVGILKRFLPRGRFCIVLDEAHSTGLFGSQGSGLAHALNCTQDIGIRLHTFGKAFACNGAVVLCSETVRSYLINYARPLVYSTSLPGLNILAVSTALRYCQTQSCDKRREKLAALIRLFHSRLSTIMRNPALDRTKSISVPSSISSLSPIVPILTDQPGALAAFLQQNGFLVRAIVWPTVPRGSERVRVCLHADNTQESVVALTERISDWTFRSSSKL